MKSRYKELYEAYLYGWGQCAANMPCKEFEKFKREAERLLGKKEGLK